MPEEVRNLCRLADISSKSLLLQVVRQDTPEKMTALVEKIASQGGATRQQLREAVGQAEGRPAEALRLRLPAADQGVQPETQFRQEPRQRATKSSTRSRRSFATSQEIEIASRSPRITRRRPAVSAGGSARVSTRLTDHRRRGLSAKARCRERSRTRRMPVRDSRWSASAPQLVNITYIIGLTGNSLVNTPVDGLCVAVRADRPRELRPASAGLRNRRVRRRAARSAGAPDAVRVSTPSASYSATKNDTTSPAATPRSASGSAISRTVPAATVAPPGPRSTQNAAATAGVVAIPERPDQPPELLADRKAHAPAASGTSATPRGRPPAGRPPAAPRRRGRTAARGRTRTAPASRPRGRRSVWCIAPATSRDLERAGAEPLEVARLLAVERRREQARSARSGAGGARDASRCC